MASICTLRFLLNVRFAMMIACHRWEFVSTLGFEWEVFTGRRPWKWSFAVYLLARFMALISVILNLVGSSLQTRYNCSVSGRSGVLDTGADRSNLTQAWWRCVLAMSWFSEAVASFLLALRGQVVHSPTCLCRNWRLIFHPNSASLFGAETQLSHRLPY